jgi:hemoglobin-like flavoprotein
MTPEQVECVQASFRKVVPIAGEAAAMFYRRLFEIAPETEALFGSDLTAQYDKLVQMLLWIVTDLHRADRVLPALEELGRRHVGYDVKAEYYDHVGNALIWTLQQGLGDEFTPEVREAWIAAYLVLAETMKRAARSAPLGDSFSMRTVEGAGTAIYGAVVWEDSFGDLAEELDAQRPREKGASSGFWWRKSGPEQGKLDTRRDE